MANSMNEHDIDRALAIVKDHAPHLARYAQFLSDWKDVVNSNSDGWPYWKTGRNAASALAGLLDKTVDAIRQGKDEFPSEGLFRKSLGTIRTAATKANLTAPELQDAPSAGFAP